VGTLLYKVGGMQAAADRFVITVKGEQTHGSKPWAGVDPVTVSAQIILGLQNIISRQTDITKEAAVISVGKIEGGVRNNIIPEEVKMIGTIRTLNTDMQDEIHERIRNTAHHIAKSAGADVDVNIQIGYPVTYNDPELTKKMISSLFKAAGEENVRVTVASTGAEDFSFFAMKVPGMYFRVGGKPLDITPREAAPHHTPDFYIDESGMITGVKAMCNLAIDYLNQH
jgi:amidohydrolase